MVAQTPRMEMRNNSDTHWQVAGDSPIKYIQTKCEVDPGLGEAMQVRRGGTGYVGGGK